MYPEEAFKDEILDEDTVPERTQRVCPRMPPSPAVFQSECSRANTSFSAADTEPG